MYSARYELRGMCEICLRGVAVNTIFGRECLAQQEQSKFVDQAFCPFCPVWAFALAVHFLDPTVNKHLETCLECHCAIQRAIPMLLMLKVKKIFLNKKTHPLSKYATKRIKQVHIVPIN